MTVTSKYFIVSSESGKNWIDFDLNLDSVLSLRGRSIEYVGSGGIDFVRVGAGLSFDFTFSNGARDNIFLPGAFGEYSFVFGDSSIELRRDFSGISERIVLGRPFASNISDRVIFADGEITTWNLSEWAGNVGVAPALALSSIKAPDTLNATVKAFAMGVGDSGEVFAPTDSGIRYELSGSSRIDHVYVNAGSRIDASNLGGSVDRIYFSRNWGEYSKEVVDFFLKFRHEQSGEEVIVAASPTAVLNDRLIFADGSVRSNDARVAILENEGRSISSITGYDALTRTPSGDPVISTSVDGVQNFDPTSEIVLSVTEAVVAASAGSGKFIRLANKDGAGFLGEARDGSQVIDVSDADQVRVVGDKIFLSPKFDLDLSNGYSISVDAGAFVSVQGGRSSVGVEGLSAFEFNTVSPGSGSGGTAAAAQSQRFSSEGFLQEGLRWLDIGGLGTPLSVANLDVSFGDYALVFKDFDTVFDPRQASEEEKQDGVGAPSIDLVVSGFGLGDVLYIDNQYNLIPNDLGLTAIFPNSSTSSTRLSFNPFDSLGARITFLGNDSPPLLTPRGDAFKLSAGEPILQSAIVSPDGLSLTLTFNEPLDANVSTVQMAPRFSINAGSAGTVSIGSVSISGSTVTLTLPATATPIPSAASLGAGAVTVSYTDPTTGDDTTGVLQDGSGNDVATFTAFQAQNDSTYTPPALPGVLSVTGPADLTEPGGGTYTVTLTGPAPASGMTLDWRLVGATASPANGADFNSVDMPFGTMTFEGGSDKGYVLVSIADDTLDEPAEGFTLQIGKLDPVTSSFQPISGAQVTSVIAASDTGSGGGTPAGPSVADVVIKSATPGSISGVLRAGDPVTVAVTMDRPTQVTGQPQIEVDVGGTPVLATYASGSGLAELLFTFVVPSGRIDTDGLSITANSLRLNGGTLQDVGGNAAVLTHPGADANPMYRVDSVVPTAQSASVSTDGRTITVTFSEDLDIAAVSSADLLSRFAVYVGNSNAWPLESAQVSGKTVVLTTPDYAPISTASLLNELGVKVAYTDLTSGDDTVGVLQDYPAGNDVAAFSGFTAQNNSTYTPAGPTLPNVQEVLGAFTVTEGQGITYTVTLDAPAPSGGMTLAWQVTPATSGASASPEDFLNTSAGQFPSDDLYFGPNATQAYVTLQIKDDTADEPAEGYFFKVGKVDAAQVFQPVADVYTIIYASDAGGGDSEAPDVSISTYPYEKILAGNYVSVNFSFTEPVVGFDLSDVIVTGGVIVNLQKYGDGYYSAEFKPNAGFDGTSTFTVPVGRYADLSGNLNDVESTWQVPTYTVQPGNSGRTYFTTPSTETSDLVIGFSEKIDFSYPEATSVSGILLAVNPDPSDLYGSNGATPPQITGFTLSTDGRVLTLKTNTQFTADDVVLVRIGSYTNLVDVDGNMLAAQDIYIGGDGPNTIDLEYFGSMSRQILRGGGGADELIGTYNADTLIDGGGADVLDGLRGGDSFFLVENGSSGSNPLASARDTVIIGFGDSRRGFGNTDAIFGDPANANSGFDWFSSDASKHDVLELESGVIGSTTSFVVTLAAQGAITSHGITAGIVTFRNSAGAEVVITQATNLGNALDYLRYNLQAPGHTVAFKADYDNNGVAESLFVYQDMGTLPLLDDAEMPDIVVRIEQPATTAATRLASVTLGNAPGANVLEIQDDFSPEPWAIDLTSSGVTFNFVEPAFGPSAGASELAMFLQVNGVGPTYKPTSLTGEGTTVLTVQSSGLNLKSSDWALVTYGGTDASNSFRDTAGNFLTAHDDDSGPTTHTFVLGSSGDNVIDLSTRTVSGWGLDVEAGAGDDRVIGTSASDWILAGKGADTLTGGGGGDQFEFQQGDSPVVTVNLAGVADDSYSLTGATYTFAGGKPEVITDFGAGDAVYLYPYLDGLTGSRWLYSPYMSVSNTYGNAPTGLPEDQTFKVLQGDLGANGVFTVGMDYGDGEDLLVLYDGDGSANVTPTAFVLQGVTMSDIQSPFNSGNAIRSNIQDPGAVPPWQPMSPAPMDGRPYATEVRGEPDTGAFAAGTTLQFKVFMNEPVAVSGSPMLQVVIGTAGNFRTVGAQFNAGDSSSNVLAFDYTMQPGDIGQFSVGNLYVPAGASIRDLSGVDAYAGISAIGNLQPVNWMYGQPVQLGTAGNDWVEPAAPADLSSAAGMATALAPLTAGSGGERDALVLTLSGFTESQLDAADVSPRSGGFALTLGSRTFQLVEGSNGHAQLSEIGSGSTVQPLKDLTASGFELLVLRFADEDGEMLDQWSIPLVTATYTDLIRPVQLTQGDVFGGQIDASVLTGAGNFQIIWSSDLADETIIGSSNSDSIDVSGGNDAISAGGGNDFLAMWGAGSSTIDGGAGADVLELPFHYVFSQGSVTTVGTGDQLWSVQIGGSEVATIERTATGFVVETATEDAQAGEFDMVTTLTNVETLRVPTFAGGFDINLASLSAGPTGTATVVYQQTVVLDDLIDETIFGDNSSAQISSTMLTVVSPDGLSSVRLIGSGLTWTDLGVGDFELTGGTFNRAEFDAGTVAGALSPAVVISGLSIGAVDLSEAIDAAWNSNLTDTSAFDALFAAYQYDITGTAGREWLEGHQWDDTLRGGGGGDTLVGWEGDDLLVPGNNLGGSDAGFIASSIGNDTIDYAGVTTGDHLLTYEHQSAGVDVSIDGVDKLGSVFKGSTNQWEDTLLGVDKFLNVANHPTVSGSAQVFGSAYADTFSVDLAGNQWISLRGLGGGDTFTISGSGWVRLDYIASPQGVNVNLADGKAYADGHGSQDSIFGKVNELRGSNHTDFLSGTAGNESFIPRGGNDVIAGGAGFDRVRYDQGTVTGLEVDLLNGTATGVQDGVAFTHSLSGIEHVRGSNAADVLMSGTGSVLLEGRAGADTYLIDDGGKVRIDGFVVGEDILELDAGVSLAQAQAALASAKVVDVSGVASAEVTFSANTVVTFRGLSVQQVGTVQPVIEPGNSPWDGMLTDLSESGYDAAVPAFGLTPDVSVFGVISQPPQAGSVSGATTLRYEVTLDTSSLPNIDPLLVFIQFGGTLGDVLSANVSSPTFDFGGNTQPMWLFDTKDLLSAGQVWATASGYSDLALYEANPLLELNTGRVATVEFTVEGDLTAAPALAVADVEIYTADWLEALLASQPPLLVAQVAESSQVMISGQFDDNWLKYSATYDASSNQTFLTAMFDENPNLDQVQPSDLIALTFPGDVTSSLVPESLTLSG